MSLPSLFVKPSQAADFTLKYANEQPVAHPTNVRAREAIEKIKAETNGKVEIQLRLEKPDQRHTSVGVTGRTKVPLASWLPAYDFCALFASDFVSASAQALANE